MERITTTFYSDFSIADKFGINAIKDTYRRAFAAWKNDIQYMTELSMVLNRKCWEYWNIGNNAYCELYSELFHKVNDYVYDNFAGEDIEFYFSVTD